MVVTPEVKRVRGSPFDPGYAVITITLLKVEAYTPSTSLLITSKSSGFLAHMLNEQDERTNATTRAAHLVSSKYRG